MGVAKSKWFVSALCASIVAATAGLTLGVLTLSGVTFRDEGSAQSVSGATRVDGLLFTANRDRLAVCIQSVGSSAAAESTAQSRVAAAIDGLSKRPDWPASLAVAPPRVDPGCPAAPAALAQGVRLIPGKFKGSFILDPFPVVDEASYYRVFVFVLPRSALDSTFGYGYASVTQEFLKNGDDLTGVTNGLYVAPEQLDDAAFMDSLLAHQLGLAPEPPALMNLPWSHPGHGHASS